MQSGTTPDGFQRARIRVGENSTPHEFGIDQRDTPEWKRDQHSSTIRLRTQTLFREDMRDISEKNNIG
jgi:hypothetical protein